MAPDTSDPANCPVCGGALAGRATWPRPEDHAPTHTECIDWALRAPPFAPEVRALRARAEQAKSPSERAVLRHLVALLERMVREWPRAAPERVEIVRVIFFGLDQLFPRAQKEYSREAHAKLRERR